MTQELENVFSSLPLFAANFLQIRTKSGEIRFFDFNRAQQYLHDRLEAQLKATGKVRALVLKGRQMGSSTYVQARYFHKVISTTGKKAFILTHEAEATKNLFDMAKRYYDSLPAGLAPKADTSNAKELNFKSLNSGYSVGTAGNKAVGRSQTIQLMHASEAAYYPHAEEHAKGILQAVSSEPETEIIIESTANGIGNYFYSMWLAATSGQSDFQAIFVPWYWQPEYTADPRENETLTLSDEEQSLLDEHASDGLTKRHLYWRRRKLLEFSNDYETAKELFCVEYPMTALEAFRNPVADRFIKANLVNKARKVKTESHSPLVIGVDVAITDRDRTAIIRRKGRLAYNLETFYNLNTMELVGVIRRIIDKESPAKVCIDVIGVGQGVYDRLREIGYDCVEGINVARSANDKDKFRNLRAELWHDMREWLAQDSPVSIPDSDELLGDLTSLGYKFDSSGRLQIESKDELRKRGMKSCDCFVAGTLVDTPDGKKPIESISYGDLVNTPVGPKRVIMTWETETESLTTIQFSNGSKLTGKPSHKIFTWNRGWVNMDALALTDVVESNSWLEKIQWKFLSLFFIKESDIGFKHQVDIIKRTAKLSRKGFYTGGFIMTIMERLKKAIISITKMETGPIIGLKTWNLSMADNMPLSICKSLCQIQNSEQGRLKGLRKPLLRRLLGTNPQRELNGINSMERKHGLEESQQKLNAQFAQNHIRPSFPPALNSALENASNLDAMPSKKQKNKSVLGVIKSFWQTNIGKLNVAPISVQTESVSMTKTYNLTLESENVYYANGILVANCADALALTFSVGDYVQTGTYISNRIDSRAAGMFI